MVSYRMLLPKAEKSSAEAYVISCSPSVFHGNIMLQEAVYRRGTHFAAGDSLFNGRTKLTILRQLRENAHLQI